LNLPHGEYLKFAKEIIEVKDNFSKVYCEFPTKPTLSYFLEAAAQSSASFDNLNCNNPKIGFLISCKDILLVSEINDNNYIFNLSKNIEINTMKQFSFEAYSKKSNNITVSGTFIILVKE
jgi:hypothetical protein